MNDLESMSNADAIAIPPNGARRRRLEQATRARRRLEAARRGRPPRTRATVGGDGATAGRAWLNGREVGGPERRYAHLGRVHD